MTPLLPDPTTPPTFHPQPIRVHQCPFVVLFHLQKAKKTLYYPTYSLNPWRAIQTSKDPTMDIGTAWEWVKDNKEWLFSGVLVAPF